jgi:hypothetical protein
LNFYLQEEKDRKRVNVRLPKIEEKLLTTIEKYETENGNSFLVGGVPFKDYWEGQVRPKNNISKDSVQSLSVRLFVYYKTVLKAF